MCSHSILERRITFFLHGLLHFVLAVIGSEVADIIPANCHDSLLTAFVPDRSSVAGGVKPIAFCFNILVCYCGTSCRFVCFCSFIAHPAADIDDCLCQQMEFGIAITSRLTVNMLTLHLFKLCIRLDLFQDCLAHPSIVVVLSDFRIFLLTGFLKTDQLSEAGIHSVFEQEVCIWIPKGKIHAKGAQVLIVVLCLLGFCLALTKLFQQLVTTRSKWLKAIYQR